MAQVHCRKCGKVLNTGYGVWLCDSCTAIEISAKQLAASREQSEKQLAASREQSEKQLAVSREQLEILREQADEARRHQEELELLEAEKIAQNAAYYEFQKNLAFLENESPQNRFKYLLDIIPKEDLIFPLHAAVQERINTSHSPRLSLSLNESFSRYRASLNECDIRIAGVTAELSNISEAVERARSECNKANWELGLLTIILVWLCLACAVATFGLGLLLLPFLFMFRKGDGPGARAAQCGNVLRAAEENARVWEKHLDKLRQHRSELVDVMSQMIRTAISSSAPEWELELSHVTRLTWPIIANFQAQFPPRTHIGINDVPEEYWVGLVRDTNTWALAGCDVSSLLRADPKAVAMPSE